jgi:hypothetical protein
MSLVLVGIQAVSAEIPGRERYRTLRTVSVVGRSSALFCKLIIWFMNAILDSVLFLEPDLADSIQ